MGPTQLLRGRCTDFSLWSNNFFFGGVKKNDVGGQKYIFLFVFVFLAVKQNNFGGSPKNLLLGVFFLRVFIFFEGLQRILLWEGGGIFFFLR